jgi:predicted kinase
MTMMSGLPGVGKDTWITKNMSGIDVVSLDGLRIEMGVHATDDQGPILQEAKQRVRKLLAAGKDFVFNATSLLENSRSKWIRLAHDYNASTRIVYIERPLSVIFEQNKQRDAVVPENVILSMLDSLEVPNLTECHELVEI